jgi:hypothetical protein
VSVQTTFISFFGGQVLDDGRVALEAAQDERPTIRRRRAAASSSP